ncbi:MAG: flagellar basal body-associated FliL family protein [Clostridia bacterium]|nr:flagellar basal body-associated FliL family protein [Clostridia bacterium]MDD4047619.1 flagellar basal body-associated FliL family protein [Clostridia bacterium]
MLQGFSKKLMVILLILLIMAMAVSGYFVYKYLTQNDTEETKIGPMYETQEFTVNAEKSTKHYIVAQFGLELTDKKVIKELDEKSCLLTDAIIEILSEQSIENLTNSKDKNNIKEILIESINNFLDEGLVVKIYLKKWLLS